MKDMNKNALSEIFLIRKMVEESRNNVNSVGNSKPSRKLEGLLESFKIRLSAKIPSKQASLGNELDVDKRSLFFEEIEIPLVEMFESIFKSSHESYEKVNRISDNIEIKLVLELLNFIADIKLGKNRLMHNLLKNEINLRGLVWYITTQFIEKWGLMGIFQTADIRKFLLEHEDLSNIRSLLKILENEHWKAIEIGFIRDHIVNSLSKLGKELYLVNLRSLKIYEQILSAIEVAHSFDPEWLKFLDLDASMIDNFSGFFCRNIFAYHTLKCIKSHFNNVDLGGILNNQINYFGEIVTMNAKLLRFNEALINRKFVKEIINFNDQFDTLSFLRPSGVLDKGPEFRKNDLQPNLLTFVFNSNGDFDCATLWTIEVTREEKALTSQFDHFFSFMNRPPEKILNWLSTAKVQQFFTSIVLTKKYFTNIVNEVNTANAKGVSEIHLTVN
ncbi:expressed protein [Phakopsora pachyrhizi]|uniref:Expressed protein n=1 Tax=Phakopsora pachyrhizi TaxID=170000 RepID=A0AAV0BFQ1_PHAPC|nr:expressed protein [Phakopsora pachyrhizi]